MTRLYIILLLFSNIFSAQQRTYFNEEWEATTKANASYYRETSKEGKLIRIKDFFINGNLQMDGLASSIKNGEEIFEGEVKWYFQDGKIEKIANFKNGKQEGVLKEYDESGQIISDLAYANNGEYSGKVYFYKDKDFAYNKIQEWKDSELILEIEYDQDITLARKEIYTTPERDKETKFYDEKGTYLGTFIGDKEGRYNGIYVEYFYHPMRVKSITDYFDFNQIQKEKAYFSNNQLKFEYSKKGDTGFKVFYNKSGQKIAELKYIKPETSNWDVSAFDGTQLYYFDGDLSDIVSTKVVLRNGDFVVVENYYENSELKEKVTYLEKDMVDKREFFNKNGSKRFEIKYRNNKPYSGTEENDRGYVFTYKEGEVINQQFYNYKDIMEYEKTYNEEKQIYEGKVFTRDQGLPKYTYTTQNYEPRFGFSGELVSFIKGKEFSRATFEDGELKNGIAIMDNEGQRVDFERKGDILNLKYYDSENIKVIKEKNIKISEIDHYAKRLVENNFFDVYNHWKQKTELDGTEGYTEDVTIYKVGNTDDINNNVQRAEVATPKPQK